MREFDEFVALGSSCVPSLSTRSLGIRKAAYPFDWIRTNNKIIYDIFKNGPEKFLSFKKNKSTKEEFYIREMYESLPFYLQKRLFDAKINSYGQYFTHYTKSSIQQIEEKFDRKFNRFFDLLKSSKKVLFIQTHEDLILNKIYREKKNLFYDYLKKINDHILEKYKDLEFTIINIDVDNKENENYKNIVNLNLEYFGEFGTSWENNVTDTQNYRNNAKLAIKDFLEI